MHWDENSWLERQAKVKWRKGHCLQTRVQLRILYHRRSCRKESKRSKGYHQARNDWLKWGMLVLWTWIKGCLKNFRWMYSSQGWLVVIKIWRRKLEKLCKGACKLIKFWNLSWKYKASIWSCFRLVKRMGGFEDIRIRNLSTMGSLVCNWVFEWLNYLYGILHNCPLLAGRSFWWINPRTIRYFTWAVDRRGI